MSTQNTACDPPFVLRGRGLFTRPCWKAMREVRCPADSLIAAMRSGREVFIPHDETVLHAGAVLVAITEAKSRQQVIQLRRALEPDPGPFRQDSVLSGDQPSHQNQKAPALPALHLYLAARTSRPLPSHL